MTYYSNTDLEQMEERFRANLINSCTGYKSANLLGSVSAEGITNLAVFNSVIHLGSNPPLLGFILRPTTVARNTYENLKETGFFSVNHIHKDIIAEAHQTSAKYPEDISEFEQTGLSPQYLNSFKAPFVKESQIKIGCSYLSEYHIKENDTLLITGRIEQLHFDESIQMPDGWLDLEKAQTVAINGLDGYALPALLARFEYARPEKKPSRISLNNSRAVNNSKNKTL